MITLSSIFEKDISYSKTEVYPIIVIDNEYYISTIKEYLTINEEKVLFNDYGLSISKLKESLNIKTSGFTISNISVSLNNYPLNQNRFSDKLIDKTNKPVQLYYKSQSCKDIEDCLLIFNGTIHNISHDNKSINLTLEDLTNNKLKKEIPTANLGFSKNVFSDNYINRPIPITYGFVEKAPVIPWVDNTEVSGLTEFNIIADDVDIVTGSQRGISIQDFNNNNDIPELKFVSGDNVDSPLFIHKGDYYRVLQKYDASVEFSGGEEDFTAFDIEQQYKINESGQFIEIKKEFTGGVPSNAPANNEFQTVKVQRPNALEVLVSEGGVAEQGNVGSIVNISPLTGILRPEAAIDHGDNPTTFFNNGNNISEFTTYATIPNNETTGENVEYFDEDNFIVNLFTIYNVNGDRKGILYPQQDDDLRYKTHYLWKVNSWLQTNAHSFSGDRAIRFINAPSGDMVVERASEKLTELGLKQSSVEIFKCYEPTATDDDLAHIYPQYCLSLNFRDAWIQACTGISGDEITSYMEQVNQFVWESTGVYEWFPDDVTKTLEPFTGIWVTNFPYNFWRNGYEFFSGENKSTIYPNTVYKIDCTLTNENSISTVYVGQWDSESMPAELEEGEVWLNLFYDENNSDKEYLFNKDDFSSFVPIAQVGKHLDNNDNNMIGTSFESYYNGIAIGTYNGSSFTSGSSLISNKIFAGGYGYWDDDSSLITMKELCDHRGDNRNSGGHSWWMIVEGIIPKGEVLQDVSSVMGTYLGENYDENCNLKINQGTLIPCNSKHYGQLTGENFTYDYLTELVPNHVTLTVGSNEAAERRLALFFPFGDLANQDEETGYTNTFVYGAFDVNIPSLSYENLDTYDEFLVQAYATNKSSIDDLNFNAEYVGESQDGVNLIKKDHIGADMHNEVFTYGGTLSWDVNNFENNADEEGNIFNDIINSRIEGWDSIDAINGLALVYRIRNNNPDTESFLNISTNVKSIGIIQYSIFNNVFDGDLYADVGGRFDDENKYTLNGSVVIENPADVLYHFIEKELEVTDVMSLESLEIARANNNDIKLAFSINEVQDSKTTIEDIAKNSRLFPKFKSDSSFSFSTIKPIYSSSQKTIKEKDIIKFSFSRTKSQDINTLINVKYRKDYASGEYKRETGYCDGYDFFGNSETENGEKREVYKNGQWSKDGYDYSFLGLKREENVVEIESDYIRDYSSAINLRNYIYLLNCNQHNIIKCTLPLRYIDLEVGDIIDFDKLIENSKAYGEDYTIENKRNGQIIYPFFMITSISKSSKDIKIEATQLHKLAGDFSAGLGSLTRKSELGLDFYNEDNMSNENFNTHITTEDKDMIMDIIVGTNYKLTTNQKISADINEDGAIGQQDLNTVALILDETSRVFGDVNRDGSVNVVDVINLVNYVLAGEFDDETYNQIADLTGDGQVNVTDIISLVNIIIGAES